jgi:F-type H+-transporting ATPase subunit b
MAELQTQATVAHAPAQESAEPTFWGFNPGAWVGLAMLVVFALLVWKKVHVAVGRALDSKIALIRDQLAEAEALRKEAEALMAEYEAKAASADKDRQALLERARHEADEVVAKAKRDAEGLIERRTRMAESKIAAEERSAVEQLRAAASDAATRAAAKIIGERHDLATDAKLVEQAIREIGGR